MGEGEGFTGLITFFTTELGELNLTTLIETNNISLIKLIKEKTFNITK